MPNLAVCEPFVSRRSSSSQIQPRTSCTWTVSLDERSVTWRVDCRRLALLAACLHVPLPLSLERVLVCVLVRTNCFESAHSEGDLRDMLKTASHREGEKESIQLAESEPIADNQRGNLYIHVTDATVARSVDPYVVVTMGPRGRAIRFNHSQAGLLHHKTSQPKFGGVARWVDAPDTCSMRVELWDRHIFGTDELLGMADITTVCNDSRHKWRSVAVDLGAIGTLHARLYFRRPGEISARPDDLFELAEDTGDPIPDGKGDSLSTVTTQVLELRDHALGFAPAPRHVKKVLMWRARRAETALIMLGTMYFAWQNMLLPGFFLALWGVLAARYLKTRVGLESREGIFAQRRIREEEKEEVRELKKEQEPSMHTKLRVAAYSMRQFNAGVHTALRVATIDTGRKLAIGVGLCLGAAVVLYILPITFFLRTAVFFGVFYLFTVEAFYQNFPNMRKRYWWPDMLMAYSRRGAMWLGTRVPKLRPYLDKLPIWERPVPMVTATKSVPEPVLLTVAAQGAPEAALSGSAEAAGQLAQTGGLLQGEPVALQTVPVVRRRSSRASPASPRRQPVLPSQNLVPAQHAVPPQQVPLMVATNPGTGAAEVHAQPVQWGLPAPPPKAGSLGISEHHVASTESTGSDKSVGSKIKDKISDVAHSVRAKAADTVQSIRGGLTHQDRHQPLDDDAADAPVASNPAAAALIQTLGAAMSDGSAAQVHATVPVEIAHPIPAQTVPAGSAPLPPLTSWPSEHGMSEPATPNLPITATNAPQYTQPSTAATTGAFPSPTVGAQIEQQAALRLPASVQGTAAGGVAVVPQQPETTDVPNQLSSIAAPLPMTEQNGFGVTTVHLHDRAMPTAAESESALLAEVAADLDLPTGLGAVTSTSPAVASGVSTPGSAAAATVDPQSAKHSQAIADLLDPALYEGGTPLSTPAGAPLGNPLAAKTAQRSSESEAALSRPAGA